MQRASTSKPDRRFRFHFSRLPLALAVATVFASPVAWADEASLKAEIAELRAQIEAMKAQMKELAAQQPKPARPAVAAQPASPAAPTAATAPSTQPPQPSQAELAARVEKLEQQVTTQAEGRCDDVLGLRRGRVLATHPQLEPDAGRFGTRGPRLGTSLRRSHAHGGRTRSRACHCVRDRQGRSGNRAVLCRTRLHRSRRWARRLVPHSDWFPQRTSRTYPVLQRLPEFRRNLDHSNDVARGRVGGLWRHRIRPQVERRAYDGL